MYFKETFGVVFGNCSLLVIIVFVVNGDPPLIYIMSTLLVMSKRGFLPTPLKSKGQVVDSSNLQR